MMMKKMRKGEDGKGEMRMKETRKGEEEGVKGCSLCSTFLGGSRPDSLPNYILIWVCLKGPDS